jgi:predicted RNase H-like HicB family nuclease
MSHYVALVDGQAGAYGVVVPDLPGCCSATVDEALFNAQEAVSLWADEMIAQGGEIPAPRTTEAAMRDPDISTVIGAGAALALVWLVRSAFPANED